MPFTSTTFVPIYKKQLPNSSRPIKMVRLVNLSKNLIKLFIKWKAVKPNAPQPQEGCTNKDESLKFSIAKKK